jgi:hypothetical protein
MKYNFEYNTFIWNLQPLTILTNLQRGNVKTLCKDAPPPHPLTFQERAAKGDLTENEVNGKLTMHIQLSTFYYIKLVEYF